MKPLPPWRLPKRFKLPHFTVKIEVGKIVDSNEEWSYDDRHGILRISPGLTINQQKYYFSHGLIHAATDYHHRMNQEGGTV